MVRNDGFEREQALGVVVKASQARRITAAHRSGQLLPVVADFGDLVGGEEDRRRFAASGGPLAERGLAPAVGADRGWLGDRGHQCRDLRAKTQCEIGGGRRGALERVVQKPGCHERVGSAGGVEQ